MKLVSVKILGFRPVSKECVLEIDPKMTVLMGANESGKTNILHAINFFNKDAVFNMNDISKTDTNRWRRKEYPTVEMTYQLNENEKEIEQIKK